MKKYILSGLVGFMLSLGVSAHAEVSSLVNQVVQGMFPVTVDNKPLGDAIVVDNKTYLPVREFGEAVGYKVSFTDDRQVVLTKNEVTPTPTASSQPATVNPKYERYKKVNEELGVTGGKIQALREEINKIKTNHATMNQSTADLEKQLSEIQAQEDKLVEEKHALEATDFK